jgi:hypothetical protein
MTAWWSISSAVYAVVGASNLITREDKINHYASLPIFGWKSFIESLNVSTKPQWRPTPVNQCAHGYPASHTSARIHLVCDEARAEVTNFYMVYLLPNNIRGNRIKHEEYENVFTRKFWKVLSSEMYRCVLCWSQLTFRTNISSPSP